MLGWLSRFAGLFARPTPPFRIFNWEFRTPKLYMGIGDRVPGENVLETILILRTGERVLGSDRPKEACLVCGHELGGWDLTKYGFIWLHKSEHYVVVHDIWVPELGALLYESRR